MSFLHRLDGDGVPCNLFTHVNLDTLKRPHLTSLFVNKCIFRFMHTKTGLYMAIIFHVNHIMKQTFEVNEHGCFTPVFSYKCRRCFRAPGSGFQDKSKANTNTAEPQQRSFGWFPNERTCKNRFSLVGGGPSLRHIFGGLGLSILFFKECSTFYVCGWLILPGYLWCWRVRSRFVWLHWMCCFVVEGDFWL